MSDYNPKRKFSLDEIDTSAVEFDKVIPKTSIIDSWTKQAMDGLMQECHDAIDRGEYPKGQKFRVEQRLGADDDGNHSMNFVAIPIFVED